MTSLEGSIRLLRILLEKVPLSKGFDASRWERDAVLVENLVENRGRAKSVAISGA
jgi:hypothetical protein